MDKNKKNFQFISLAEASEITGYTQEYLNALSRGKRLQAEKIGRNWHTTKEWLRDYFLTENGIKKRTNNKIEEFLKSMETNALTNEAKDREIVDFNFDHQQQVEKLEKSKEELAAKNFFLKEEIRKTKQKIKLSTILIGIFIFYFGISFVRYSYLKLKNEEQNYSQSEWQEVTENFEKGKVKGEETENQRYRFSNTAMASENFVVKEISFGGDVLIAAGGSEKISPEIFDVKSESFLSKDKLSSYLVVTWKTNKATSNEIEYSKNNGDEMKRLKQSNYGFSHGVIISKLKPGTPYIYKIKATDRWGNSVVSDTFAIYSGLKEISIFELIFQELEKMFNWTTK